jgi:hypothetical protein
MKSKSWRCRSVHPLFGALPLGGGIAGGNAGMLEHRCLDVGEN